MESKGKQICKILKDVRKEIADANGIDYTPSHCYNEGFCVGTCPMCEQEKSYLEKQLTLKQKAGKAIKIVGIASGIAAMMGQPLYAQTPETIQEDSVLSWDMYFFDFNGGPFSADEAILDEAAELVVTNPDEIYIVIGKTDARGSESYNLKLSQVRAKYICQRIKDKYVDKPLKIVPVGAGFYDLTIQNAQDETEHEQNRKATLETYNPNQHAGKLAAMIEYAICKEFGVTIPEKIEKEYTSLNSLPYDEGKMKNDYDKLAEALRKLRDK